MRLKMLLFILFNLILIGGALAFGYCPVACMVRGNSDGVCKVSAEDSPCSSDESDIGIAINCLTRGLEGTACCCMP
jgi:hypothetical protein